MIRSLTTSLALIRKKRSLIGIVGGVLVIIGIVSTPYAAKKTETHQDDKSSPIRSAAQASPQADLKKTAKPDIKDSSGSTHPTSQQASAKTKTAVQSTSRTYKVQEGDTLSTIAEDFGTTTQALLKSNPKLQKDPNYLMAGQTLNLEPKKGLTKSSLSRWIQEVNAKLEGLEPEDKATVARMKAPFAANPLTYESLILHKLKDFSDDLKTDLESYNFRKFRRALAFNKKFSKNELNLGRKLNLLALASGNLEEVYRKKLETLVNKTNVPSVHAIQRQLKEKIRENIQKLDSEKKKLKDAAYQKAAEETIFYQKAITKVNAVQQIVNFKKNRWRVQLDATPRLLANQTSSLPSVNLSYLEPSLSEPKDDQQSDCVKESGSITCTEEALAELRKIIKAILESDNDDGSGSKQPVCKGINELFDPGVNFPLSRTDNL